MFSRRFSYCGFHRITMAMALNRNRRKNSLTLDWIYWTEILRYLTHKSDDRGNCFWLLLAACDGLINASSKWKVISDQILIEVRFETLRSMPQLFMMKKRTHPTAALAKIVGNMLLCWPSNFVNMITDEINSKLNLDVIVQGPGLL